MDSKIPIVCNNSTHAPLWQFYLHCKVEVTGTSGIIWIICHQVLRHLSEHGTRSIEKHLLPKEHITKLNELVESEVSEMKSTTMVETTFAIFKRLDSWEITIVNLQKKSRFISSKQSILTQLTLTMFETLDKELPNCGIWTWYQISLHHITICFD